MPDLSGYIPWFLVLLGILLLWWSMVPLRRMMKNPDILVGPFFLPVPTLLSCAAFAGSFWLFGDIWKNGTYIAGLVALGYLIYLAISTARDRLQIQRTRMGR